MEKGRKNRPAGQKKNRRRKKGGTFSYYYTHALRALKRRKKKVMAAAVCVLAACCMLLAVWALVRGLSGRNMEAEIETVEDVAGEPIDTTEPLEENAHPEVNDLVGRYFTALQEGDEETLTSLRDNTGTADLLRMQENSSHIEAYTDISCYTKSGLEADSYVVFACYEVKFQGIDTTLPGIAPLYVRRNAEGTYYLHDLTQDEEAAAYVNEIAAQEDVAALYDKVNSEYAARLEADETLSAYVESYMNDMMVAVGEALEEQTAEAESTQGTESGTDDASEADSGEDAGGTGGENSSSQENTGASSISAGTSSAVPDSGEFTVSETVNIRKGVSETSEKIAVCYPGETLEILMKQADGWTRVRYQGQTGYVRSDVLK
ncbi:MAG TPA: SH3 domain-containing protein [Candidatus Eisenbergiella stercoravium]|nr:SH3 domain-containing protein [Candidatus Eisenbergiella stercoravium]